MPKEIGTKPNPFNGDRKQTTNFLTMCKGYLDLNDTVYTNDKSKIYFILFLCTEGPALAWATEFMNTAITIVPPAQAAPGIGTFDDFITAFEKEFSDIDPTTSAISELNHLRQTGTLAEYITAFRPIVARSKITTFAVLRNYFLKGLNGGLHRSIAAAPTQPTTMAALYQLAESINNAYLEFREIRGQNQKVDGGLGKKAQSNKSEARGGQTRLAKLTDDERTRLAKEGRCFRCRNKGHRAFECPNKQGNSQNIRSTQTNENPEPVNDDPIADLRARIGRLSQEQKDRLAEDF